MTDPELIKALDAVVVALDKGISLGSEVIDGGIVELWLSRQQAMELIERLRR